MPLILALANDNVTVTFSLSEALTWIIIGFIAGTLAELLVRGYGRGIIVNIIVGLIGAFVGGLLLTALHPSISPSLQGGITLSYIDIIVSFVGAVIVLVILSAVFRRRP